MIPILYSKNEKNFSTNGIGILTECLECTVTETRNGAYEAELIYPVNGRLYPYISEKCFIKAKANETSELQIFRIYGSSKPMDGMVTFKAEHISYSLSGIPIESVTVKSGKAQYAMDQIFSSGIHDHGFSAYSDIDTLGSTLLSFISIRAALGGVKNSVLDVYGGEYEFDNFNVKLHKQRGTDTGVIIAYGKNLTDIKQEKNISEMYTAVFPYAKIASTAEEAGEITITLPEKIITTSVYQDSVYHNTLIKDFSEYFAEGEEITPELLRSKTAAWIKTSGIETPKVSLTVSFKRLWDSPEYKHYAILERVRLCDIISVYFPKLGVSAKAKVVKTVFNSITEKYISLELGDARPNLASTINKNISDIDEVKETIKTQSTAMSAKLADAILDVTEAITGQKGGYVVLNPANNPQEILILDTPNISTALNVWRWNSAGLGHSSTGYNGPFTTAITSDGRIVADLITAGILRGELLEAGSVRSSALSASYKNEVTNEITGASNKVEQAFVAADEQLRSLIKNVSAALTDEKQYTEERISEILQTVSNLTVSFSDQYTGGINSITNSSGLNGISSEWEYTGLVQTLQNTDTKNNTVSGSCFVLNSGMLSQKISVIAGSTYILTFKAKKTGVNGSVKISCSDTEHYVFSNSEQFDWTEYHISFLTPSNLITVEMNSLGDSLYVADLMLTEGTAKRRWSPAPNEIYTSSAKIDRYGIYFSNSDDRSMTMMNSREFSILDEGKKAVTINKELSVFPKAVVTEEFEAVGLKFFKVNGGVDITLIDDQGGM